MNEYEKVSKNDYYTKFDKNCSCWAVNHNGWRKAKKLWRKIAKTKIKREVKKQIQEEIS